MVQSFGSSAAVSRLTPNYKTDKVCPECGEELMLTEAIVLLQIVIPQLNEMSQVVYTPFEGPNGSYAYEPYFFHPGCWKLNEEALDEMLAEYDCHAVQDDYSFMTCKLCFSGLRLGEPLAMVLHGELHANRRSPDGIHLPTFAPYTNKRELLCLSCIRTLNDEIIELWDHISYNGECPSCTYDRAWRTGEECRHDYQDEEFGTDVLTEEGE